MIYPTVPASPDCDCDVCLSAPAPAPAPFFAGEMVWDEACGFEHVSGEPCPPHEPIRQETDPETGKKAFPWFSRNGKEVSASGWVYGCDCGTCAERQRNDGSKYLG